MDGEARSHALDRRPADPEMLDVLGFDTATQLISDFAHGTRPTAARFPRERGDAIRTFCLVVQ
jgi:hypothetical protein